MRLKSAQNETNLFTSLAIGVEPLDICTAD